MPDNAAKSSGWHSLPPAEQAFVAAYVNEGYSLRDAAISIGIAEAVCKKYLSRADVRAAIVEVQTELDSIDFLNEKWVRAQLLKLYPKVIGEEAVPIVTAQGEKVNAHKFMPEIAMKIIEYVAPRPQVIKADVKGDLGVSLSAVSGLDDAGISQLVSLLGVNKQ